MTTRTRGEFACPKDSIILDAQFRNMYGQLADPISFPNVSLIDPKGNVILPPTSLGVSRVGVGQYNYIYEVPYTGPLGVYIDRWEGVMDGYSCGWDGYRYEVNEYNFVIQQTQMPALNTDGYIHLGDDVPFKYNQTETCNINKFIKGLRARLNSRGKARKKDEFGNVIYEDCDIYTVEQLVVFIATALSAFNEIPHFTQFTFNDTEIITLFYEVILQCAVFYALGSKALIERGREFTINDNGVTFNPPSVAEMLNTQYQTEMSNWFEKVKLIKQNMKSRMLGLGTLTMTGSSPQLLKMRHLRSRQVF